MAQDGAGVIREEALDRVEPEPCLGVKVKSKRPAAGCRAGSGFPRNVCGMIVEDQLDRGAGRIGGIEKLRNSMNSRLRWRSLTSAWTLPVSRSIPANRLSVPWRLYS